MPAQVVRLRSGETVAVRTGVLRGAGPQGPSGPPGATGAQGVPGPVGPKGDVNALRAFMRSTASVATSSSQWYPAAMDELVVNDLLTTPYNALAWSFKESGVYLAIVKIRFEKSANPSSGGARKVQLVDQSGAAILEASLEAVGNEPTSFTASAVVDINAAFNYHLEARSYDSAGISLTTRSIVFIRVGAGSQGALGPVGPVGATGPQGSQGPAGNASTGFASYNAEAGGANAETDPGGSIGATTDQAIPYPLGAQKPYSPFFFKTLATFIEKRIIARFASAADRDGKRAARSAGEVYYLLDTGVPYFHEKDNTESILPRAVISAAVPPTGVGAAAPGTLWLQV